jgi:hypothetical protein
VAVDRRRHDVAAAHRSGDQPARTHRADGDGRAAARNRPVGQRPHRVGLPAELPARSRADRHRPEPARAITAREWQLIAKDPGAHRGEPIIVHGEVTQFDAATGAAGFRANVDGVVHKPKYGFADYDTNTVLAGSQSQLADVVRGDLFTAEVVVGEPLTYETTMGGQLTAPSLTITSISVTGHLD